ncbi:DUF4468 domain-containing protein [Dysgonomonas sp. 25]|uniref:DUF4468 domain-containing protein n=1 Tax=Dysgonomonas sp. 25 TaxID=2302933 RepID=UPI0013D00827|nr:DUF4468 domain-containing protein [Dysgonomonas sp. 25]NDV70313.1 DUF4468 domain-containing protein [Dysgonomonas sp. 25]
MSGKYLLLLAAILLSATSLIAQDDTPYLKGAVTEMNGKVVFNKVINSNPKLDDTQLFNKVNEWAEKTYNLNDGKTSNRVLLSDASKKQVACLGETNIVFGRKLISLDMAGMTYQLILKVDNGACDATVKGINYDYSSGKENEKLFAEDMITDKYGLTKKGDKLANYYGKFRKATIDSINVIFQSLEQYINGASKKKEVQIVYIDKATGQQIAQPDVATPPAQTTAPVQTAAPIQAATPLATTGTTFEGYKSISPDNIPGNYIKLLNDWTLVTSGKGENVNVMTASWGGLGTFWNKPVTFLFLNPTRHSIKTMDEGETYTISFYSAAYKDVLLYCGSNSGKDTDKVKGSGLTPVKLPSGATAFTEAWMIIECRKIIAQPISEAAVKIAKSELEAGWTKDGLHKMYMGEILNVWVK